MRINSSDTRSLLGQFTLQKFLTERIIKFAYDEGVIELIASMQQFGIDEIMDAFQYKLGYKFHDSTRSRIAKVFIDLLQECEYLKNENGRYLWNDQRDDFIDLQEDEYEIIKKTFKGQFIFFEECIVYADKFLRGSPPLYDFNSNSIHIWEEFLGNDEYKFVRSVLLKLLFFDKQANCNVLDLCYGPGFDILQIQEKSPEISVTALDFKDIFYEQAIRRILNPNTVNWIKSELWNGFGAPLPFNDNTFDIVFFACADPYIPPELREFVYRDIFRILKHGGHLGIMTHSYPDINREFVKDTWIRKGVLCHDFLESVCKGWHGFYDPEESVTLFKKIGYNISSIMLNASVWRLDKA